tara:strand:+ start:709 stop:840 length:132 start_codon:yes stop_codon:yes gene_type:complete
MVSAYSKTTIAEVSHNNKKPYVVYFELISTYSEERSHPQAIAE